ncbi:MAG: response regulator transcription factor, partial [Pseudomonadales bacterium]|nr:response regulator transcription factor [Pseudomonadales bacterium]
MKILIADDHGLVIEAVKAKLAEIGPDVEFRIAVKVDDLEREATLDIDLALIDLTMPGANGYQHIAGLRQRLPALPIIVLSGLEDREVMRAVLDLGALGFIPKSYSPAVMLSAVRLVLSGGVYVPPMLLSSAAQANGGTVAQASANAALSAPLPAATLDAVTSTLTLEQVRSLLTERQLDVLGLLSQGKSNKLIA